MKPITKVFRSWDSYAKALELSLNTEFYSVKYPDYQELYDNDINDYDIVKHLLDNKYDPQKGFNLFVKACFNGSRYIGDVFANGSLNKCFNEFISKGAKIDEKWIKNIFTFKYDDFEDNETHLLAKAALLNEFIALNIDIKKYCPNWDDVKSDDWDNDTLDMNTQCLSNLKHYCEGLKMRTL